MITTTLLLFSLPTLAGPTLAGGSTPTAEKQPAAPAAAQPLVAPQASEEDEGWTGSLLFGFTQISGNQRSRSVNLDLNATKTVGKHRHQIKGFYAKATQGGTSPGGNTPTAPSTPNQTTAATLGASYDYNYLAGERYYYIGTAGFEKDRPANLDLRYYAGGGVGYAFYDTETFDYDGEVALTYFKEELSPAGLPKTDNDSIVLKLSHALRYDFNERTRFMQDLDFFPAIDDFRDNFLRVDSRLESNLTDRMVGSIQYVLDRDNTPAVGTRRTDHRLVVSLGWGFGA